VLKWIIILSIIRYYSKPYYDTNSYDTPSIFERQPASATKGGYMYVNNVCIVGNLTSDPQMGGTDGRLANFRIAVNRWRRPGQESDDDVSVKDRTEFIDVECWGSQAENIGSSLKRGDRAIVAGQLKFNQWSDEEGNLKSRLRIKAFAVGASLEFQSLST
jgi:single stranded DNA-binding protein